MQRMKRDDTRRLRLHRETLRVLRDDQLGRVRGAFCDDTVGPGRPKTNAWTGSANEAQACG
jgi:hypothetical protein